MYAFRFCPDCGATLAPVEAERLLSQSCAACGAVAEPVGGLLRPADDLAEVHWFAPHALPTEFAFAHCADVLAAWRRSRVD